MDDTTHRVVFDDATDMNELDDESIDLVVTSPPYPMVEMWDDAFSEANPAVRDALEDGNGNEAFDEMHSVLNEVWSEVDRVLAPNGTVCVNIGDGVRTVGGSFSQYPNRTRIINWFTSNGYSMLPDIVWRKPANGPTKFVGSGMVPPNAYVAYEHEYILIFRKGGETRSFEPKLNERYESAYFWEERNEWFSDLWSDLPGVNQSLSKDTSNRERSAAFPLELPYRLILMYSIYGDTILDPFLGTGTSSLAAACAARNSVGYELDGGFRDSIQEKLETAPEVSRVKNEQRLNNHLQFTTRDDVDCSYEAEEYPFSVKTKQERNISLYHADEVAAIDSGCKFTVSHTRTSLNSL